MSTDIVYLCVSALPLLTAIGTLSLAAASSCGWSPPRSMHAPDRPRSYVVLSRLTQRRFIPPRRWRCHPAPFSVRLWLFHGTLIEATRSQSLWCRSQKFLKKAPSRIRELPDREGARVDTKKKKYVASRLKPLSLSASAVTHGICSYLLMWHSFSSPESNSTLGSVILPADRSKRTPHRYATVS